MSERDLSDATGAVIELKTERWTPQRFYFYKLFAFCIFSSQTYNPPYPPEVSIPTDGLDNLAPKTARTWRRRATESRVCLQRLEESPIPKKILQFYAKKMPKSTLLIGGVDYVLVICDNKKELRFKVIVHPEEALVFADYWYEQDSAGFRNVHNNVSGFTDSLT